MMDIISYNYIEAPHYKQLQDFSQTSTSHVKTHRLPPNTNNQYQLPSIILYLPSISTNAYANSHYSGININIRLLCDRKVYKKNSFKSSSNAQRIFQL
jgi:hypothetical protein